MAFNKGIRKWVHHPIEHHPMEASETWDALGHLCQLYQPKTKFFVIWVSLYGHDTNGCFNWMMKHIFTRWFKPCPFHYRSLEVTFSPLERVTFSPSQKGNELNHQVLGKWLEITISIHWEVTLAFRFQGAWTPRGEFQILHFFGSPFREPRKALLIEKLKIDHSTQSYGENIAWKWRIGRWFCFILVIFLFHLYKLFAIKTKRQIFCWLRTKFISSFSALPIFSQNKYINRYIYIYLYQKNLSIPWGQTSPVSKSACTISPLGFLVYWKFLMKKSS